MARYTYTVRSVTVGLRIGPIAVSACTAALGGLTEHFVRPDKASWAMGPGGKATLPARVKAKQSRARVAAEKHNAARARYLVLASKTGGRPSEGDPVYMIGQATPLSVGVAPHEQPFDRVPPWLSEGSDFARLYLIGRLSGRENGRTGPWTVGPPTTRMWLDHAERCAS